MVIRLREASSFSARERRKEEEKEGGIRKQRSRSLRCNDGLGWAGVCRRITVCLGSERGSPRPMFQSPRSRFAPTVNMKIEKCTMCTIKNRSTRSDGLCVRSEIPSANRKANNAASLSLWRYFSCCTSCEPRSLSQINDLCACDVIRAQSCSCVSSVWLEIKIMKKVDFFRR